MFYPSKMPAFQYCMLTLDREFGFVFVTSHKYKIIQNSDPLKIKNRGNTEEERSIRKEST